MARLRLAINLPTFGGFLGGDLAAVVDVARACEDAGVDEVTVSDHVVMGPDVSLYPFGTFPIAADEPWMEPLAVLAAVAGATRRVTLHTSILVAPLRPAALLAKQVATVDALARGRLSLGVGTGWQEAEFATLGADYPARGRVLEETVAACRALWRDRPARFDGEHVRFGDTYCSPPVAGGGAGVPVAFAGRLTSRTLRRIVSLGDGWHPLVRSTPDEVAAGVARLREALGAAGRDPGALTVHHSIPLVRDRDGRADPAASFADLGAWAAAGVTTVQCAARAWAAGPGEIPARLADVAVAFRAAA
jgi:probable F420-dependent oxidoreductase